MKFLFQAFFSVFLLSNIHFSYGQIPLSDRAEISLLTCGSGDQLYSIYGHTALRINDPGRGIDIVYNYGTFDFSTPNFYGKFVKGDLQYFVSTSSFEEFNYSYVYDNREITEQVLNLTQPQKQMIFNELSEVLSSEKRFYTYKFIDRNCTTMVADLINSVLPEKISTKIPDTEKTYRTILYGYLKNNFYENLGINLMFGIKTDRKSDKLFLPVELQQGVALSRNNNESLVKEEKTVYKKVENGSNKSLWNNYFSFVVLMLIPLLFSGKRIFQLIWLTLSGVLGIFFATVGLYSEHQEVLWNYNVLLMNPCFLVLAFLLLQKNTNGIKKMIIFCSLCLIGYTAFIAAKVQLVMMLPLILTNAVLFYQIWKKHSPKPEK
ncbi:lipoprotein N-acyltransferase Lnb domain-containing protein [Flavobacterium suncheonense]|uniref:lipoprotein N-acyltransferase Lnb domain-containing protein n=1 Tax=Flavobacterium suncheonense TaxID=350894 RepID=UPI003FA3865B